MPSTNNCIVVMHRLAIRCLQGSITNRLKKLKCQASENGPVVKDYFITGSNTTGGQQVGRVTV